MSPFGTKHSKRRDKAVAVLLRSPTGEGRGAVLELSSAGCSVQLTSPGPWVPGELLVIELQNVLLLEPLRTLATCTEGSAAGTLTLEFAEPALVKRELPYALLAAYNRRRSPRVPIADVVEVRLGDQAGTQNESELALLIDVSVIGVGLRLPVDTSGELALGQILGISFSLPDVADSFQLSGSIKSLWPTGGYVGCGVQLDRSIPAFEAQRKRLAEAVALRRERLRAAR